MKTCPCESCLILPICKATVKTSISYVEKVKSCSILFDFLECVNVEPTCIYWNYSIVSREEAKKRLEISRSILPYEPDLIGYS